MSNLKRYVNGCVGKRRFGSEKNAKRYAKWVLRKFDDRQEPYFCMDCGWWHIGHKKKGGQHGKRQDNT
jgi:hypothetical protein